MPEELSPLVCPLHPGATFHKNGKLRSDGRRYRCGACKQANDKTDAERKSRRRANGTASTKRTPQEQEDERARKRASYLKAKEAEKSLEIGLNPLDICIYK